MKKFKIRTAASLKKILEKKTRNEREQYQYYYLKGIYDSRMFGLCIYRLKPSCDFKNLIIYRVSKNEVAGCDNCRDEQGFTIGNMYVCDKCGRQVP